MSPRQIEDIREEHRRARVRHQSADNSMKMIHLGEMLGIERVVCCLNNLDLNAELTSLRQEECR